MLVARLDHGIAGSVFHKQELVNISNCQQEGGPLHFKFELFKVPVGTSLLLTCKSGHVFSAFM